MHLYPSSLPAHKNIFWKGFCLKILCFIFTVLPSVSFQVSMFWYYCLLAFQTCSWSFINKAFEKCQNIKFLKFLSAAIVLSRFRNMVFQLIWAMQWLHTTQESIQYTFSFMMPGKRFGTSELPAQKSTHTWNLQGIDEASSTETSWWVNCVADVHFVLCYFLNNFLLSEKAGCSESSRC